VISYPTAYIARDTAFTQDVRQIPGYSSCSGNASAPYLWFNGSTQLTSIPVQRGVTYYWKFGTNGTRYSFTVASAGVLFVSPQVISSGWLLNNSPNQAVNYLSFGFPYALFGSGLTAPITITAQSGASLAISANGPFSSTLSLTPSNGVINTTLYAFANPRQTGQFSTSIVHQSGSASATLQMSGTGVNFAVYRPTINFGTVAVGVPSPSESSLVIGGALAGNTTITAPTGFQIALSQAGPYQSSLSVPSVSNQFGTPGYLGDVTGITLWVRCFSSVAGTFVGNVTFSNPAASQNGTLAVSATVTPRTALQQDSLALVDLYNSTGGQQWSVKTNWLSAVPLTSWYGITIRNNRVAEINLTSNNLRGSLPSSLSNLSQLTVLALGDNHISSQFPASLSTLVNLQELYLRSNQLTGTIPSFVNGLTSLRILELEDNTFTGAIPDFTLPNLEKLRLDENQLSGTLPSSLGNLSKLTYLELGSNQLSGTIPSFLGNLSRLKSLNLTKNLFTGTIPGFLGNLSNLSELYIGDNQLIGTIPSFLGNLSNLTGLSLRNNQLNGEIPSSLGNLRSLDFLSLHGNNTLTGDVPASFGNLTRLTMLALGNNQFTRLPNLSGLGLLDSVTLENNRFVFADVESLAARSIRRITYAPQDSIGDAQTLSVQAGAPLTLTLPSAARAAESPSNYYQWFKSGVALAGQTSPTLTKTAVASDSGVYLCHIRNDRAGRLTLFTRSYTVNISAQPPALSVSAPTLALGTTNLGMASPAQSYTLTGANLSSPVTITAPAGVELSEQQNGSYMQTLTFPANGSLSTQIFVRLSGASIGSVNGTITHTSGGVSFASANVAVSGTVNELLPRLQVDNTSLSFGSVQVGQTSATQTLTVSGSNLTGNVTVNAPNGFQVSFPSDSWQSSLPLPLSSGRLNQQVYVQFLPASAGDFSNTITISGGGASTQQVAVSGTGVPPPPSLLVSLTSLNFDTTRVGNTSSVQSYLLTGQNLDPASAVTITTPSGFVVSSSNTPNSTYSTSLTLRPTASSLSQQMFVRFAPSPSQAGRITGTITHTIGGQTLATLPVTGTGRANRPPRYVGRTASLGLSLGQVVSMRLDTMFVDDDGDPLTVAATSSAPSIATATVNGNVLTMTSVGLGSAQITVSANDGREIAQSVLTATVTAQIGFAAGGASSVAVGDVLTLRLGSPSSSLSQRFQIRIRTNARVLYPVNATTNDRPGSNPSRSDVFTLNALNDPIQYRALLGDTDRTTLTLESVQAVDAANNLIPNNTLALNAAAQTTTVNITGTNGRFLLPRTSSLTLRTLPNPTADDVDMVLSSSSLSLTTVPVVVKLFDVYGREVYEMQSEAAAATTPDLTYELRLKADLRTMTAGVYLCVVRVGAAQTTATIMIAR
jgi:Leucine-rich repeat (LRR) protein